MATVNLGAIKFNWKGAYSNSTAYAVDDVVSSGGSSYVCIQAHTNQPVGNATAYWNIMSSAGTNGTNGTDVGTTLTTQGDILFRDGSGLQRLPKGTAGQVLKMNSSANAPEYGTVASDFVRTAYANASGSSDTLALNGCFSTTYKHYKVIINFSPGTTTAGYVRFQNASNAELTGSHYQMSGKQVSNNSSPNDSTIGFWNSGYISPQENAEAASDRFGAYEFDIFDPANSALKARWLLRYTSFDGSVNRWVTCGGGYNNAEAITGIRIYAANGGNLQTKTWMAVYGFKYN